MSKENDRIFCKGCGREGFVFRGEPRPRLYSCGMTLMRVIDERGVEQSSHWSGWLCFSCKRKFDIVKEKNVAEIVKQRMEMLYEK